MFLLSLVLSHSLVLVDLVFQICVSAYKRWTTVWIFFFSLSHRTTSYSVVVENSWLCCFKALWKGSFYFLLLIVRLLVCSLTVATVFVTTLLALVSCSSVFDKNMGQYKHSCNMIAAATFNRTDFQMNQYNTSNDENVFIDNNDGNHDERDTPIFIIYCSILSQRKICFRFRKNVHWKEKKKKKWLAFSMSSRQCCMFKWWFFFWNKQNHLLQCI